MANRCMKYRDRPRKSQNAFAYVEEEEEPTVTVLLRYGPYSACGVVDYRLHRLEGMQRVLRKAGFKVELEKMDDRNLVELIVHGEKIFTCDIRELDFGSDGMMDKLCAGALYQVEHAY